MIDSPTVPCGKVHVKLLPAIGGPIIMGKDMIPRTHPMACDALCGPTKLNATGPIMEKKAPSKTPMIRMVAQRAMKFRMSGNSAVETPITRKAS